MLASLLVLLHWEFYEPMHNNLITCKVKQYEMYIVKGKNSELSIVRTDDQIEFTLIEARQIC